ncbi:hypothetical protein [Siphonobacter sp. SORGH_AS_0500]|uniref:hypothetical protein n=1 Tax=Siphonobacter sp. SORGH_AS_0500 TaxID=1864824 RepID=UPI00286046B4|nr:hypothetical protein [Siphonobacter sp. SORGH_AS_0500]MDR6196143.1 hypothetical protein [Siphonobacter sp. SORGH_AS_0500]
MARPLNSSDRTRRHSYVLGGSGYGRLLDSQRDFQQEDVDPLGPVFDLVSEWANYTKERLLKQLDRKKIGITDELKRSIDYKIRVEGDQITATFSFLLYGRFVDMGVSNGIKASDRSAYREASAGAEKKRVAKKWFNKPFYGRVYWLMEAIPLQTTERILNTFAGVSNPPIILE